MIYLYDTTVMTDPLFTLLFLLPSVFLYALKSLIKYAGESYEKKTLASILMIYVALITLLSIIGVSHGWPRYSIPLFEIFAAGHIRRRSSVNTMPKNLDNSHLVIRAPPARHDPLER